MTSVCMATYNGERIKVLHHRKNPKLAKVKHSRNFYYATENFENALKEARGDFIFLSDQDDVWLPGKKEKMISAMEESGADCVMCNCQMIDSNGKKIERKSLSEGNPPRGLCDVAGNPEKRILRHEHKHGRSRLPREQVLRFRKQAQDFQVAVEHSSPRTENSVSQVCKIFFALCSQRIL